MSRRELVSSFVPEIVEGVKRGGGSPLRPAIDESAVEEEVSFSSLLTLELPERSKRAHFVNVKISQIYCTI